MADALQITMAKKVQATVFITRDKDLAEIAEAEGLKPLYLYRMIGIIPYTISR